MDILLEILAKLLLRGSVRAFGLGPTLAVLLGVPVLLYVAASIAAVVFCGACSALGMVMIVLQGLFGSGALDLVPPAGPADVVVDGTRLALTPERHRTIRLAQGPH